MEIDKTKYIKMLLFQCKALKKNVERTLDDKETPASGRYSSFKIYASQFNNLASDVCNELRIQRNCFPTYNINDMPGWADSLWPYQRQVVESVLMGTDMMLSYLEAATEFSDDEFNSLENFLAQSQNLWDLGFRT